MMGSKAKGAMPCCGMAIETGGVFQAQVLGLFYRHCLPND